jgi:hypothetical protein
MPRQGLHVMRRQTSRFIAENPSDVVVTRTTEVSDGAGGTTRGPATPLPPQRVRVVPQTMLTESRTSSGEMLRPDAAMVAEWDANIQRDDTIAHNGFTYRVSFVHDKGYEKLVEVVIV